jgi:hypothetical protein
VLVATPLHICLQATAQQEITSTVQACTGLFRSQDKEKFSFRPYKCDFHWHFKLSQCHTNLMTQDKIYFMRSVGKEELYIYITCIITPLDAPCCYMSFTFLGKVPVRGYIYSFPKLWNIVHLYHMHSPLEGHSHRYQRTKNLLNEWW